VFNIAGALPFSLAPAMAPGHPGGRRRKLRSAVRGRGRQCPGSAPPPSCPEAGPIGIAHRKRCSSSARRTAARRLFTPSLA
jgi:hypothetical protein